MSETKSEDTTAQQKNIQYYLATATAWYATKLERDKSLLTLSASGIALLVTFLTTGNIFNLWILMLYFFAIISFITALSAILAIFNMNATYLEQIINNKELNTTSTVLCLLDKTALISFGLGVFLSFVIGLVTGINTLTRQEGVMADSKQITSNVTVGNESFVGAINIQPETKSFAGANNISPQPPTSSTASNSSASTPSTSTSQSTEKK